MRVRSRWPISMTGWWRRWRRSCRRPTWALYRIRRCTICRLPRWTTAPIFSVSASISFCCLRPARCPIFGRTRRIRAARPVPTAGKALVFGNPASDAGLPILVHAAEEARSVSGILATPVYTGVDASEGRLYRAASAASVIHLAAHGSYNEANPLYSAIYLAPDGSDDGRLEVREVYGANLAANPLVVLSACQTNLGQLSKGDDVVGLTPRLFLCRRAFGRLQPMGGGRSGDQGVDGGLLWFLGGRTQQGGRAAAGAGGRTPALSQPVRSGGVCAERRSGDGDGGRAGCAVWWSGCCARGGEAVGTV